MKTRNLIQNIIALAMVCMTTLAGLTACTDKNDNPSANPASSEVLQGGARDIMNGRLFKVISIDTLDRCRLAVAALTNVDVKATAPSASFAAQITEIGGQRYVTLTQKQEMANGVELVNLQVTPKNAPDHARNVLLVFRDPSKPVVDDDGEVIFEAKTSQVHASRRAAGVPSSVYSQILGHGTNCFGAVGNTQSTIFLFDKFSQLGQNYFEVNEQAGSGRSFQISKSDYTNTMEDWTAAIGINFKATRTKIISTPLRKGFLSFLNKKKKVVWQGTVNVDLAGSSTNVNDYEYQMSVYQVKKGDAILNMNKFNFIDKSPTAKKWSTLLEIIDEDFIDEACLTDSMDFDTKLFFDTWGTDIITQGTFGGHYTYLYARKHGIWENAIDIDVKANLKRTKPTWMNALTGTAPDGWTADVDATYARDDYQELSGSWESVTYEGGGDSFESPEKWAQGFSDTKNWRLISYRMATDNSFGVENYNFEDDESDYTYPIEKLIINIIAGWVKIQQETGVELSSDDMAALNNAVACANRLVEDRDIYVLSRGRVSDPSGTLLLADLQVVYETGNHKDQNLGPRIMADPWGTKRIYYPVMANKYFYNKSHIGYPLNFYQAPVVSSANSYYYLYYAIDTEHYTKGLVDVTFKGGKEDGKWKSESYYPSGEQGNSNYGEGIYVRQYEPQIHKAEDRIAACGLLWIHANKEQPYTVFNHAYSDFEHKIIGSTGGAELSPVATVAQQQEWEERWNIANYSDEKWQKNDTYNNWYGFRFSRLSHDDGIYMYQCIIGKITGPVDGLYTTTQDFLFLIPNRKPVYVSSLKNITQPKNWNE